MSRKIDGSLPRSKRYGSFEIVQARLLDDDDHHARQKNGTSRCTESNSPLVMVLNTTDSVIITAFTPLTKVIIY